MGNLRDESKLRNMKPTDVILGADEDGCLVNINMPNTSIMVKQNPIVNTPNYSVNTLGTVSSINQKPLLTGYPTHTSLASAQAVEIKCTMYYNTTLNTFATVI